MFTYGKIESYLKKIRMEKNWVLEKGGEKERKKGRMDGWMDAAAPALIHLFLYVHNPGRTDV